MADAGLSVYLKQRTPIRLDVSLDCAVGEVLALVGPSGSGKSTILRTIAGLYRPTQARVTLNGVDWLNTEKNIHTPPHRRRVGLVFQNYALFPHMTALENVMAALGHIAKPARRTRALELFTLIHLTGLENRKPAELSGGQQQRVAVARALARDPEVLLLDEPFSAVDKATRYSLYAELRALTDTLALPIIFVTHDFDEAARLAGRMCILDSGTIIQTGAPREVLAKPVNARAALLVDLKNVFEARIVHHDETRTWLDWNGRQIEAQRADSHAVGSRVSWAIPGTQVLISRTDIATKDETPNRFAATVRDLAYLSESISASVVLDGPDAPVLSMTLPAHYARRTGLVAGSQITIAIMPDGAHVMGKSRSDEVTAR